MEFLAQVLPLIIYVLISALLVVLIVIGIKIIIMIKRAEQLMDEVNDKIQAIKKIFNKVDRTTEKLSGVSDIIVEKIIDFIGSKFRKKKGKDNE